MLTMFHIWKVIITYLNCQISFKVLRMNNIVNLTIPCYLMPLLPFFCMHYSFHYFGKFYDKFCSRKKSFTFSHYSRIWYMEKTYELSCHIVSGVREFPVFYSNQDLSLKLSKTKNSFKLESSYQVRIRVTISSSFVLGKISESNVLYLICFL